MFDFRKRDGEKPAVTEEENYYGDSDNAGQNNYDTSGDTQGAYYDNTVQYDNSSQSVYDENAYEANDGQQGYNQGYDPNVYQEDNSQQYGEQTEQYSEQGEEYAAEQTEYGDEVQSGIGTISAQSAENIAQTDNSAASDDGVQAEEVQLTFDPNDFVVNMTFDNVPIFETDYMSLTKEEKDRFIECILESFRTSVLNISSLVGLVMRKNKRLQKCDEVMKAFEYQKVDFENYKRRNAALEEKTRDEAIIKTIKNVLPTLDNFDRALPMIFDEKVKEGVELIYRQLKKGLNGLGVEEMEALGQEFDPDYHNAVLTAESQSPDDVDRVVEVMQKGYMLNGKVVRYAQVKVAK